MRRSAARLYCSSKKLTRVTKPMPRLRGIYMRIREERQRLKRTTKLMQRVRVRLREAQVQSLHTSRKMT